MRVFTRYVDNIFTCLAYMVLCFRVFFPPILIQLTSNYAYDYTCMLKACEYFLSGMFD